MHLRLDSCDKSLIEFFAKLGFLEVSKVIHSVVDNGSGDNGCRGGQEEQESTVIFLGRNL